MNPCLDKRTKCKQEDGIWTFSPICFSSPLSYVTAGRKAITLHVLFGTALFFYLTNIGVLKHMTMSLRIIFALVVISGVTGDNNVTTTTPTDAADRLSHADSLLGSEEKTHLSGEVRMGLASDSTG